MIRSLLARLIPAAARGTRSPRVYGPDKHPVRRAQLSPGALAVTRRLHEHGFKAFVVGGAVRDLMLGIVPKDFDIATDARPEEVKPLFRRAFLIGRRFRLVHVHAGSETVEVSTFRAAQVGDDATDEHGRLIEDNVYGSQAEDAVRRDFAINALYFDPADETVWDYVGGVADIRARRLKLIGTPTVRYREDPVRMLRGVRLASKLGLEIEAKTAAPIAKLAPLIQNVPPARLFDEIQKLLLSGHAVETLRSMREHGLHHGLLPLLDVILEQPLGQRFVEAALASTDRRVREERGVSPAFLFATLLWHEVLARWGAGRTAGERSMIALTKAMDAVLDDQAKRLAIPRRFEATMKEIWSLQPRFEQRSGSRPFRFLEHPRFRAAWDFLDLRCQSGELEGELAQLADWWARFADAGHHERESMLRHDESPRKRRRSRGRGRGAKRQAVADAAGESPGGSATS